MHWMSMIWLAIQATLTIGMAELLRRRVLFAIGRLPNQGVIVDLWAPILLLMPMLAFIAKVDHTVVGSGWMTLGAPITCALLGLGLAMVVSGWSADESARAEVVPRMLVACCGAGVLLVLLGAAHDLNLFAGQIVFAIGAMLLWANSPDVPESSEQEINEQRQAGSAMTLALLMAIGQAIASSFVREQDAKVSGALTLAGAAVVLATAAVHGGPWAAIRIGGWTAAYGVLMSIGILSLRTLLPQAIIALDNREVLIHERVVYGFGAYAVEACALLLVGVSAFASAFPRWLRAALGVLIIIAVAALAALRLAHV